MWLILDLMYHGTAAAAAGGWSALHSSLFMHAPLFVTSHQAAFDGEARKKKREEQSCVLYSIRLCWLLLFFHDTSECLSQAREFIQRELHTWVPAKS